MVHGELSGGDSPNGRQSAHSVAIVGVGPKGLYCLERLLAEVKAQPLDHPLHIHLFNRSAKFGASPIYDPDQPEYILVNISVGEIDLWTAENPPPAAGRGGSFLAWYQDTFQPQTPLTGDEYLSRAVVGRYLEEGFRRICSQLPQKTTLTCHVGEVEDIRQDRKGYQLKLVSKNGQAAQIRADKILLSTGHSWLMPDIHEESYRDFALRHSNTMFIPFVYPVIETMRQIPSGTRIAMKGIGLTFIDAVLELTEGRGGRFVRTAHNTLVYHASGEEPLSIFPFSRSGLPMAPKAFDLPLVERPLTFFTRRAFGELKDRAPNRKLDLEKDLWPLFELEMEREYYRVLMQDSSSTRSQLELCGNDAGKMHRLIDTYLSAIPDRERFDYRPVLDPVGERRFKTCTQFVSFIEHYMEQEIARARRGQSGCGIKAAVDIWYEVRHELGSALEFGGLTPESHQKLIEHYYPRLKRVVFGPPIISIEKLLALQKAGLLDFSVAQNPVVVLNETESCYELRCDEIPGAIAQAEILVDARYPSVKIAQDATPLYRNLFRRGMVREYENQESVGDHRAHRPGAIDMTPTSQFVIDVSGKVNEDIAVIGIPTEGNLVGNLTLARDAYPGIWAAQVIEQLRQRERPSHKKAKHAPALG